MIENEGKYYLYRHIRLDTGEPFYIGIGTKFTDRAYTYKGIYRRAFVKSKRNNFWKSIVNKTGYEVEILLESDDYKFINQKEIELITLYGRRDLNKGTLVNLTDGGDGVFNLISRNEYVKTGINNVINKRKKESIEGLIYPTKSGGNIEIIEYVNHKNVKIKFIDGGEFRKVTLMEIRRGILKNNFKASVSNFGYLGGEIIDKKAHVAWTSLISKYINTCGIYEEWSNYQNFAKWHKENYNFKTMQGWVLCTNILEKESNKCGKSNCYYLPLKLSNQLKEIQGFHKRKDGNISSKFLNKHLSYHRTKEEAINNTKLVKKEFIINVANEYKNIFSEELYNKILNYEIRIKNQP